MRIPMPCRLGGMAECDGMVLPLSGVSWFDWSSWGMEYTYYFSVKDRWGGRTKMYTTFGTEQPFNVSVPDSLLIDRPIKEHGYPLKGKGHACGLHHKDGNTYIDFIMTDRYWAHIRVQCDEKWEFVPNGDIILPPSWDTEEKKGSALLKAYGASLGKGPDRKGTTGMQMSIFDFIDRKDKG